MINIVLFMYASLQIMNINLHIIQALKKIATHSIKTMILVPVLI